MANSSADGESITQMTRLLHIVRKGGTESISGLLEPCREYLLAVANSELDSWMRVKVGASDLVQETFVAAYKNFEDFRGASEAELLGWLRTILLNNMATIVRSYRFTEKRCVDREVPLSHAVTRASPSTRNPLSELLRDEKVERVQAAIGQLNDDYRQAIELRSIQQLQFDEIGQRMGRSEDAARKLWGRAIIALTELLESPHDSD